MSYYNVRMCYNVIIDYNVILLYFVICQILRLIWHGERALIFLNNQGLGDKCRLLFVNIRRI